MEDSAEGPERSYDTVPRRTDTPVMYSEGEDPDEALEFLQNLSDNSELHVTDYNMGIQIYPGDNPVNGAEVAQGLETEEGEGYNLAIYGEGGDPLERPEIYVAFSGGLPRSTGELLTGESPSMVNGTQVQGHDPEMSTEELWEEARKAGVRDVRPSRKADNAFRTLFGHSLD